MAREDAQAPGVLVVDGEILVRHALADYLRHCGFAVIEAASTDEALQVLAEVAIRVDAVLCDGEAPGSLNAFALRHRARDIAHRTDITFMLAGNVEAAVRRAAGLCEDGPHLARPYEPQSVVDYIRRLLQATKRP